MTGMRSVSTSLDLPIDQETPQRPKGRALSFGRRLAVAEDSRPPAHSRWVLLLLLFGTALVVFVFAFSWLLTAGANAQTYAVDSPYILKKWYRLGGTETLGAALSDDEGTPLSGVVYQRFDNGVIVYSNTYGARYLSTPIFDRWLSCSGVIDHPGALFQDLLAFVGPPRGDLQTRAETEFEPAYDFCEFEKAIIFGIGPDKSQTVLLVGDLYRCWDQNIWVGNERWLGPPTSDQEIYGFGSAQHFRNGTVLCPFAGVPAALTTSMYDRWVAEGGLSGLGWPVGDQALVDDGTAVRGSVATFEHGKIFDSFAPGSEKVALYDSPDASILSTYEQTCAGVTGWLGMPVTQGTASYGTQWVDFEGGIIVQRGSTILPIRHLNLFVRRFESMGSDPWYRPGPELYVNMTISDNYGDPDVELEYGDKNPSAPNEFDVLQSVEFLGPDRVVNHDLQVHVLCWGYDWDWPDPDDTLGWVIDDYDIDNLWGLAESDDSHWTGNVEEQFFFGAYFEISNPGVPYSLAPEDFRYTQWWPADNFSTPGMPWYLFSQTFSDVGVDEDHWLNPFNWIYYEITKGIGGAGNCFGMSLESIYAEKGRSPWAEPIATSQWHWQDLTASGDRTWWEAEQVTSWDNLQHRNITEEIAIKNAYQLGAEAIDYVAGQVLSGNTHDPQHAYSASKDSFAEDDDPVLCVRPAYLGMIGHAVRPYLWIDAGTTTPEGVSTPFDLIRIADPNYQGVMGVSGYPANSFKNDKSVITVTDQNRFEYWQTIPDYAPPGELWSGGEWTGGRLFSIPYSVLDHQPRTPFYETLGLLAGGIYIFASNTAETEQVTDQEGHRLFVEGLGPGPKRWDQMEPDSTRIPNVAPITFSGGTGGEAEAYYMKANGDAQTFAVGLGPDEADGTAYNWIMSSGSFAVAVETSGTLGKPDLLTCAAVGTEEQAFVFQTPADSQAKHVKLTFTGQDQDHWTELQWDATPGQSVTVAPVNDGTGCSLTNDGPATTVTVEVKPGVDVDPVPAGTVEVGADETVSLAFDTPRTTLGSAGGLAGEDGWLRSAVTVTLSAKDFSGTGIDYIEYSADQVNWTRYEAPFSYAEEGVTTLYYRAVDNEANQESPRSTEFKIDTREPVLSVEADQGSYTRDQLAGIDWSAEDPMPGSGLESSSCVLGGEPVADGGSIDLIWRPLGTHTLVVSAEDVAGWSSTAQVQFELVANMPGLVATIERLRSMGEIYSDGFAEALTSIAEAALSADEKDQHRAVSRQLDAFLRLLAVGSGRQLSSKAAGVLDSDACYIQERLF